MSATPQTTLNPCELTETELIIAAMWSCHYYKTRNEIAFARQISNWTVDNHIKSIYSKMEVNDRFQFYFKFREVYPEIAFDPFTKNNRQWSFAISQHALNSN